ncbi:hypothetical protein MKW98_008418 [Papaver atlanticum]|uniref:Replication protein A OB domain-containing protein n=1 Tax=Papaver atlanticum TaxID=357466 RepID=A0AAD4SJI9_9MAGN|nr:hypothetical protein MKW98_008418 [Papaver atlanticum]
MREITIENLRGSTMRIKLWGSATNQVWNDLIDCDSILGPVLVAVCSTFVKNYQGKITLSSENATIVYTNATYLKSLKCTVQFRSTSESLSS